MPVLVFHRHVRRIRVGQLFHFGNGCLSTAAQFAGLNDRLLVRIESDAFGHQGHILALYVGNLILRFRTHAAFLVHNGVPDRIEQLLLRPGKFRLLVFLYHGLIGSVIPQVCRRTGIGFTAGQHEHIRQRALALVATEMGIVFTDLYRIVILLFNIALIGFIFQQELRHRIIGRAVCFGEHGCIRIVAVLKFGEFLIHVPDIRSRLIQRIFHQLLIGCIGFQIFVGRSINRPVRFGKFLFDTFLYRKLGKLPGDILHILLSCTCRQRLIDRIVLQIIRHAVVGLSGAILFGKLLPQRKLAAAALKFLKLLLYAGLIIRRVLFQTPDVRAFIIFRARNQPRIDPVMDQIVFVYVIALIRLGQCVKQAAVLCFQIHIAFMGNDGTYPHIATLLRNIDIGLCFGIHAGRILAQAECFRRRIYYN